MHHHTPTIDETILDLVRRGLPRTVTVTDEIILDCVRETLGNTRPETVSMGNLEVVCEIIARRVLRRVT